MKKEKHVNRIYTVNTKHHFLFTIKNVYNKFWRNFGIFFTIRSIMKSRKSLCILSLPGDIGKKAMTVVELDVKDFFNGVRENKVSTNLNEEIIGQNRNFFHILAFQVDVLFRQEGYLVILSQHFLRVIVWVASVHRDGIIGQVRFAMMAMGGERFVMMLLWVGKSLKKVAVCASLSQICKSLHLIQLFSMSLFDSNWSSHRLIFPL